MGLFRNRRPTRLERELSGHDLSEALIAAEATGPLAPFRLKEGVPLTAVTDAGQAVTGTVARVWQTFADSQSGAFRVLVVPAAEDSAGEGAVAS